jgi:hypothetical protein
MAKLPLLSGFGALSMGLLSLVTQVAPASADPVRIYYPTNGYRPYQGQSNYIYGSPISSPIPVNRIDRPYQGQSNYIYGSPIPSPIPVNPVTGSSVTPQSYNGYNIRQPRRYYRGDRQIDNSILVNPTLINSDVSNSVLVNPTIIDTNTPNYLRRSDRYTQPYWYY